MWTWHSSLLKIKRCVFYLFIAQAFGIDCPTLAKYGPVCWSIAGSVPGHDPDLTYKSPGAIFPVNLFSCSK